MLLLWLMLPMAAKHSSARVLCAPDASSLHSPCPKDIEAYRVLVTYWEAQQPRVQ